MYFIFNIVKNFYYMDKLQYFFSKMVGVLFGCNFMMEIVGIMEILIEIFWWGVYFKCQEGVVYVFMEVVYYNYVY